MAGASPLDPRALAGLILVVCAAAVGVSSPPVNGDVVVYAEQLDALDLFARWVHVGWMFTALPLRVVLPGLYALQLTSALLTTYVAWRWRDEPVAVVGLASLVAPMVGFGEVEPGWVLMGALALWAEERRRSWAVWCWGWAVAISPTALVMLFAASLAQRRAQPAWVGALSVVGLCLLSWGGWLWGQRGLLTMAEQPLLVGRNLESAGWLLVRMPLLWLTWRSRAWWAAPLTLVAPPDVPALWGVAMVALWDQRGALEAAWRRWMWLALAWQLLVAGALQIHEHQRAMGRDHAVREMPCADAVVGSWSDAQLARQYCPGILRARQRSCTVPAGVILRLPSAANADGERLSGDTAEAVHRSVCVVE